MTRTYSREKIRTKSQKEKMPGEKSAKPSIGVLLQWSREKSVPPTRKYEGTSDIFQPGRLTRDWCPELVLGAGPLGSFSLTCSQTPGTQKDVV